MTRARADNAHVRGRTPGARQMPAAEAVSQVAPDALPRLLNDPEFTRAFDKVRAELISRIENNIPATADTQELEREYCRSLRSLNALRRTLAVSGQLTSLKEHDFRSHSPPKDADARTAEK